MFNHELSDSQDLPLPVLSPFLVVPWASWDARRVGGESERLCYVPQSWHTRDN
jgi:hypothetical protein